GRGGNNAPANRIPAERVHVVADAETNTIMVKAKPLDMAAIKKLVKESLDVTSDDSNKTIKTHVIGPLKNAKADDVAEVIKDVYRESMNNNARERVAPRLLLFGRPQNQLNIDPTGAPKGVTLSVSVDTPTNSLVISCPTDMYKDIKKLVEMLEKAAANTKQTVQVIRVKGIDPKVLQQAIDALQGNPNTNNNNNNLIAPTFFPRMPFGRFGQPPTVAPQGGGGRRANQRSSLGPRFFEQRVKDDPRSDPKCVTVGKPSQGRAGISTFAADNEGPALGGSEEQQASKKDEKNDKDQKQENNDDEEEAPASVAPRLPA